MNLPDPTPVLDYERLRAIVRRRGPVVLASILIVACSALFFSEQQTKKYTATSALVFNSNQINQQVAGLSATAPSSPTTEQATNVQLLTQGPVATEVAAHLGGGVTPQGIQNSVSVSAVGESSLIELSATWTSPTMAARIANAYANRFVADQLTSNQTYFGSALALVRKQLHALSPQQRASLQGLALQDRAQSLSILAHLPATDVKLARAASVPTTPSSPRISRNTILGAGVGLLLGLILVLILERFDRRLREPSDLEKVFDLPLLGAIPASGAISRQMENPADARLPLPFSDQQGFHMLRAHLRYFNVDRDIRVVMVASAASGDGKTTISRNLAEAASAMGARVLLIETDLRRPRLAKLLSLTGSPGIVGVLIGAVPLHQAVASSRLESASNGSSSSAPGIDVLTAGVVAPPNPAALIESQAMRDLIAQVRIEYDFVVIDSTPLAAVSDAFPLLSQVDGVIIVSRLDKNRRDVAVRLQAVLRGTEAPLLGVVANAIEPRKLDGYGYGYGYGSREASEAPSESSASAAQQSSSASRVPQG